MGMNSLARGSKTRVTLQPNLLVNELLQTPIAPRAVWNVLSATFSLVLPSDFFGQTLHQDFELTITSQSK